MDKYESGIGNPEHLGLPTPWPNANARLLGLGMGLPIAPIDRLALFDAGEFERFTLEWATGYLKKNLPDIYEVQQRGGAGDKGRDVIVWHDAPGASPRRWSLYQCKHYSAALGAGPTVRSGMTIYGGSITPVTVLLEVYKGPSTIASASFEFIRPPATLCPRK